MSAAPATAPAAVVFDIGRVLIEWRPEAVYDAAIGRERRERFFAEVPIEAMNLEVDRGADLSASVEALAAEYPDWAGPIRMWCDRWAEMVTPDIPASAHLLRALRARGVPVFALTNFGVDTFGIAQGMYPVLTEFDRAFVSGRLRQVKPDAEIYETLERETGLSGAELLFTDDRPENIDAAAARGWRTHLFESPEGLGGRLVAEGLLQPADLP
ncbi:HAD family phosphatase [Palleronia sediminis]|uniref:HAD family phosphatase n=1 Tax=Palleronia sediminis TaxID=2547833 RepID=A0A4R6A421_9RHOB|nr:HAD family phosphatase [Palleronia sediminis]TDL78401.1 HAD family phosphatase [Palleronia sediminis]